MQLADSGKILCYADVYQKYVQSGCSLGTLHEKRSIIGQIQAFDQYGKYPDGCRNQALIPKGSYQFLNAEYKAIIDFHNETATKRGKKEKTISSESATASVLFLKLQQSGVKRLEDADDENILSLFIAPNGCIEKSYSCKSQFAIVLKTCVSKFPNCTDILSFLPVFKKKRKNIQYLTSQECSKVKEALLSKIFGLTLRDRAMGILAFYTGLRSCDIAGMKLNAIDWEKDTLHIRQQKTDIPLTLPLSAIVGNAIYNYIELERPITDCEYIFISQQRPFGRIQGGASMSGVADRIMKSANIRQNDGDRKGMHIFRHHLASALLENGISRPIISSIMGQSSPKSLDKYLSTDFIHLKECSVSIENFPVAQEVFDI